MKRDMPEAPDISACIGALASRIVGRPLEPGGHLAIESHSAEILMDSQAETMPPACLEERLEEVGWWSG